MKPFISIIGGKVRRAKRLAGLLPSSRCYVEAFGGSAAVLFAKDKSPVEVYNDADGELVNLFEVVQREPERLSEALKCLPASRRLYNDLKRGPSDETDAVYRAARYYFILKNSFSCKPGQGFRTSNKEPARYRMFIGFGEWSRRLDGVYIEELAFEKLLVKYDGPDTVFFVDPPYPGREKYYGGKFKPADHDRLRDMLAATGGRWLLTYPDSEEVRGMYRFFNITDEPALYSAGLARGGPRFRARELVIANYDLGG